MEWRFNFGLPGYIRALVVLVVRVESKDHGVVTDQWKLYGALFRLPLRYATCRITVHALEWTAVVVS